MRLLLVFAALSIVLVTPAAAQMGNMSIDPATGQFAITFPAPLGDVHCDGTYRDNLVSATARMVAAPNDYFTVNASTHPAGGWNIIVSYSVFGELRYRLLPGGGRTLESTTLPSGGCAQMQQSSLFRSLKLTDDYLLENRVWSVDADFAGIAAAIHMFVDGADLVADCWAATRPHDNHGCDWGPDSCGPNGKCCDEHDSCYARHGCNQGSWFCLMPYRNPDGYQEYACNNGGPIAQCRECNLAAARCVAFTDPGPSECCQVQKCGQPRGVAGMTW